MFGPPIAFFIYGFYKRKTDPQRAKMFYILGVVYLVVGGGICYSLIT